MNHGPREAGDTFGPSARLPATCIKRRLNIAFKKMLAKSGKAQVYLELFSGSGKIAKSLARQGALCM